jgi:hypothetical protein
MSPQDETVTVASTQLHSISRIRWISQQQQQDQFYPHSPIAEEKDRWYTRW